MNGGLTPPVAASIVVLAVVATVGFAVFRDIVGERAFQREPPSPERREAAYTTLLSAFPKQPEDASTALFLLEESKRHYEALTSGAKSVENKATQVLALAAGGSSALVLFGVPKDGRAIAPGPLVDAALALTLCALLSLLFVLRVKARNEPSVAEYLSAPMAADPANRTALAMSLAEDFEARCSELSWARRRDPLAMFTAYLCLAAAALLVVLNAVLPVANTTHAEKQAGQRGYLAAVGRASAETLIVAPVSEGPSERGASR